MNTKDAVALIEEALEVDEGTIRGDETLESIDWTSLAAVTIIGLVDEKLGKTLDPKSIARCTTVSDLTALLTSLG
jgi:acyl carrier protein